MDVTSAVRSRDLALMHDAVLSHMYLYSRYRCRKHVCQVPRPTTRCPIALLLWAVQAVVDACPVLSTSLYRTKRDTQSTRKGRLRQRP